MNVTNENEMKNEQAPKTAVSEIPSLWRAVLARPRLTLALEIFDKLAVLASAAVYLYVLIACALVGWQITTRLLISTAVPFVAVSVFRRLWRAPRPCELYDLSPFIDTSARKRGSSFPSRHVFSAFVIGSSVAFVDLPLGISVMIIGVILGACRVLTATHFVRDVVAGGLLGGLCGSLGMIIVNFN